METHPQHIRGNNTMTKLTIKTVKNKYGCNVYHVEETIDGHGIVQEFWTMKDANEYIRYVQRLEV